MRRANDPALTHTGSQGASAEQCGHVCASCGVEHLHEPGRDFHRLRDRDRVLHAGELANLSIRDARCPADSNTGIARRI